MNDQELKELWKSQPTVAAGLTTDQLKSATSTFQRRIRVRNLIEYICAAAVVAGNIYYIWIFPFLLMRIGCGLTILGVLFVTYQLNRRASNGSPPSASVGLSYLNFLREELVRQRDAARSAWLWYVGPFLPGMIVFLWGAQTELHASDPPARGLIAGGVVFAIVVSIIWLNRQAARKLQDKIDQIDQFDR